MGVDIYSEYEFKFKMMVNEDWSSQLRLFVQQTLCQQNDNTQIQREQPTQSRVPQPDPQEDKENLNPNIQISAGLVPGSGAEFTLGYELSKKERRKMKAKHKRLREYEIADGQK